MTMTTPTVDPSAAAPGLPDTSWEAGLSDSDVRTLQRALAVLKSARAEVAGPDPAAATKAKQRLSDVLCYLGGYLDARTTSAQLNPGFASIFQSSLVKPTDLDAQLDQFEKELEQALDPDTRFIIAIGIGLICLGVALKTLAD